MKRIETRRRDLKVRGRVTGLVILLATVGACDRPAGDPARGVLDPQYAPVGSPAPFTLMVKDGGGQLVSGAVGRLIDGSGAVYTMGATVNGTATLSLPTTDYCVSVRLAPPSAMAEPVIVPDAVPVNLASELVGLRTDLSPVLLTKNGIATFTAAGYVTCLRDTPTKHNGSGTTVEVVMPASAQYKLDLVGPDGASLFQDGYLVEIAGYAVTPTATQGKRPGNFTFDPDLKDGFLQSVSHSTAVTPAPLLFGVAPNQSFQIEFQQVASAQGRTFNFTATLGPIPGAAAGGTPLPLPTLFAEPLFCNQVFETFPKLTKFVSVNYGYMADPRLIGPGDTNLTEVLLANLTVVPVELVVGGGETYTVSFREDLADGSRKSSDISFTCIGTSCVTTEQKTSGGSGHIIFPFYRALDATTVKATFFLTGLAPDNMDLTLSAKGQGTGEAIPIPSKKNANAAYITVPPPPGASCPVRDSNDDKFFVGIG